jgi:hypothetical protein
MTTTLDEVIRGMFSFQIHSKWVRMDNLLRVALGIPLPSKGIGLKKSSIPGSLVNLLKQLLKLFAVDADGKLKNNGKFNGQGFRCTSYNELQNRMWGSRSTVNRGIRALKDAGIIDAHQEVNPDGTLGVWWVRLNPGVLAKWASELSERKAVKTNPPMLNNEQLLSSLKQKSESAVAVADTDSAKKEIEPPCGEHSFSKKGDDRSMESRLVENPAVETRMELPTVEMPFVESTTINPGSATATDPHSTSQHLGFEQFAREEILKTETGNVAKILEPLFPDVSHADAPHLQKLHNLVYHAIPMLRLDRTMAELLVTTMANDPERLGRFAKMGVVAHDANGEDSCRLAFLLKFWPGICGQLWTTRLFMYDMETEDVRFGLDRLKATLFSPVDTAELKQAWKDNPGYYWVRCLALALNHKWSAAVVAVVAAKARAYLLHAPVTYAIFRSRFPQVIRLCRIPEHGHKKLLAEAMQTETRVKVWNSLHSFYGFEFVPSPFQQ